MTTPSNQGGGQPNIHAEASPEWVNTALRGYSDKDWNYSRISLISRSLDDIEGPYVLHLETLSLDFKQGRNDLKALRDEVQWGERHSSVLGMLELVSLRLNKALLDVTSDDYWQGKRPVVRIAKKEALKAQGVTSALWYEVREVPGVDFDNR